MGENLGNALLISVIGMGLVFVMILLLWGLMAFMVRILPEKEAVEEIQETLSASIEGAVSPAPVSDADLKRKAAAVAVAIALARQTRRGVGVLTTPAGSSLTAWQTVMRANQIKSKQQRGPVR